MTRWGTLAIALLFSAFATDTASSQDGWITLFDGKNLDQWQSDGTATFVIEDGSVIAKDKKDPKAVAAYLVSKQSFIRADRVADARRADPGGDEAGRKGPRQGPPARVGGAPPQVPACRPRRSPAPTSARRWCWTSTPPW